MLEWIMYQIPWWLWAVLIVIALSAALYFWRNLKVILVIAAGAAAAIFLHRSRQQGYQDRIKEEDRANDALEDEYREIENRLRDVPAAYDRLKRMSKRDADRR